MMDKNVEEYRRELESIVTTLEPFVVSVEIRGSGLAQFVFVDKIYKALELS